MAIPDFRIIPDRTARTGATREMAQQPAASSSYQVARKNFPGGYFDCVQ